MSGPASDTPHAGLAAPSPWVCRWAGLIRPGGRVLDLACGSGRHVRWLASKGFAVTGVDRDAAALEPLRTIAEVRVADLEGAPWPLPGERFDAVVVTNYLWRPLWPELLAALAEGGVLIYETFADGNQNVGKPSRADFLLRHGELLNMARGLRIVAYEDGYLEPPARFVQRIAAVVDGSNDRRYALCVGPAPGA
ncbi:MAG: class I SAM-dependent methyltransferase [Rubrivivax sp.]